MLSLTALEVNGLWAWVTSAMGHRGGLGLRPGGPEGQLLHGWGQFF